MNSVDIIILVVMAAFLVKGALRGLLKEVCSLLGLLLGGFLAFRYQAPLGEVMMETLDWPAQVCVVLAFLALFISCVVLFGVIGYLLSRFVKMVFLGGLNRVAGGFFGLAQAIMLLAIVLFALSLRPLGGISLALEHSQLAPPLVVLGESAMQGSRSLLGGG
jgi:membrane protein required for colicin V production